MSKFDGVFKKTAESAKVQTAESPKKMGRPVGKKSDPAYRQVTIYLPTDLHDLGRDEAMRLQRSANKAERKDFSEIVEEALRLRYQKSESLPKSQHVAQHRDSDQAQKVQPNGGGRVNDM